MARSSQSTPATSAPRKRATPPAATTPATPQPAPQPPAPQPVVEATPAPAPAPQPALSVLNEAPETPGVTRYPVLFTLANDGSGGDHQYEIMLTSEQILRVLSDDESPRWIRLPERYCISPGNPPHYARVANMSEIHVYGGWQPPQDDVEWRAR